MILSTSVVLVAVAVAFLLFIVRTVRSYIHSRHHHLSNIPGPPLAAWTRIWLVRLLTSKDMATEFRQINKQYGPLVRVGPDHLLTDDVDVMKRVLGVHSLYDRSESSDAFILEKGRVNIINAKSIHQHNEIRSKMAAGWSAQEVSNLGEIVDSCLSEWIKYIDEKILSPTTVPMVFDIGKSITYFTLDVIMQVAFGQPYGFIQSHEDANGFPSLLMERLPIVERFQIFPEAVRVMRFILELPYINRQWVDKINDLTRPGVARCFSPDNKTQNTMINSFIKRGIPRAQVNSEATMILLAGFHTSATAIRAILLHIITHPHVHSTLLRELDQAYASDGVTSYERALQLPYLQACVREALRLFPPVVQLRERVVPSGGDTLAGHFIPAGTKISMNQRGLMLSPVFGEDADAFIPERWLKAEGEAADHFAKRLISMERVWDLQFGWGATRCLGMKLALLSVNRCVVEVLRRYEINVLDEMKIRSNVWLEEMMVSIKKRDT